MAPIVILSAVFIGFEAREEGIGVADFCCAVSAEVNVISRIIAGSEIGHGEGAEGFEIGHDGVHDQLRLVFQKAARVGEDGIKGFGEDALGLAVGQG